MWLRDPMQADLSSRLRRLRRPRPYGKRHALATPLRPLAGALGYRLVEQHFYSPIPQLDSVPEDHWAEPRPHPGIALDLDRQLQFLQAELGPHLRAFHPPRQATGDPTQFHLDNSYYRTVEAEVLHALLKHLRPKRVVELGSGFSTLIIAAACAANEREGHPAVYDVYDPFPGTVAPALEAGLPGLTDFRAVSATEVPRSAFAELGSGDVLFVDTTHTVKLGGDVNRIVLEVLPELAPGVVVHFHDVFLPWDYPRYWVEDMERYWAEQYLLQAFLAGNDAWEVLLATYALTRAHPAELASLIDSFDPARQPPGVPAAFWIRRVT